MKYSHSDNYNKNWFSTSKTNETEVIENYWEEHCRVFDDDICGDRVVYFMFDTGKCYELSYSWWITYDPEWEIHNDYDIIEVSKDVASKYVFSDRDWIIP